MLLFGNLDEQIEIGQQPEPHTRKPDSFGDLAPERAKTKMQVITITKNWVNNVVRFANLQKQIESISNQNISEQAIEELQHGMHIHSEILDTLHNNMQTHETMINTTNKDMSVHRQSVQDVSKTIETSRKQQQQNLTKTNEQICEVQNNLQNLRNSTEHDKKLRDLETEMARTQAQVQSVYARTGNEVQLCPPRSRPMKKNSNFDSYH